MWTAVLAVKKQDRFRSLTRGLGPFLLIWAAILVPVLLEPDFSTAALIAMLGCIIVFAAGARVGHFIFLGLLATPAVLYQFAADFRFRRLIVFLNPGSHTTGAGYQVEQSLIAIGSGGIGGVGFGEGQQKFGFLPEAHNDFIFALIGEEWGLIGVGRAGLRLRRPDRDRLPHRPPRGRSAGRAAGGRLHQPSSPCTRSSTWASI